MKVYNVIHSFILGLERENTFFSTFDYVQSTFLMIDF